VFDLTTVWMLIILFGVFAVFWQFRKFAELARVQAKQYCQRYHLQLLSVPQREWKVSFSNGVKLVIYYELNYSADGLSAQKGEIEMINGKINQISHWG
jgi:hypothetical protein